MNDHLKNRPETQALAEALQELETLTQKWGNNHPELVNTLSRIGGLYWECGQYFKSVAFGEQALDILEKELGFADSQAVTGAENLISALVRIKQFSKAQRIRDRFFNNLPEDHPRYAYFLALNAYIAKESTKGGFRPPSAKKKRKKKRGKK
jgi:tetratricopeptide (TPR) repeat protein